MKKIFISAIFAMAFGAMMTACNNANNQEEVIADSMEVEMVYDTVKYFGNGLTEGSQAEFIIINDQLACVVEGEQTFDSLNAEVFLWQHYARRT